MLHVQIYLEYDKRIFFLLEINFKKLYWIFHNSIYLFHTDYNEYM